MIIQLGKYRRTSDNSWHYDREIVSIDLVEETVRVRDVDRSNWGYRSWGHRIETDAYFAQQRSLKRYFRKMKDYR